MFLTASAYFQARNKTNSFRNVSTSPPTLVLDDEDEFIERKKWKTVQKLVHVRQKYSLER